ncbi:YcaO-like family protein [Roseibium sp.]|uniref:YcaO-like family protein n=1 Tax=Roseibium sp. TaxID=1936156 RepID=UPI003BAE9D62
MDISNPKGRLEPPAELSNLGETVIADLVRVGLLSSDHGGDMPKLRMVDEGLRLFVPLLERYQIKLVPMERPECPVHFCTGILKLPAEPSLQSAQSGLSIPAGGQGNSLQKATLSCLGELAERVSLCSLGDHDPRVFLTGNGQPQVDFLSFVGLSAAQQAVVTQRFGQGFQKTAAADPDWNRFSARRVKLASITGNGLLELPAFAVLLQESERTIGGALSLASSVGCAVWPSRDEARKRALLELAERDAVALTWYNRLGITFLPVGILREILSPELVAHMDAGPRRWGVYLLQTDLAVQVAIAVSHDADGRTCAFGSAAGWDAASACSSALEELLQSENALQLMDKSYPASEKMVRIPKQLAYARRRSILEDLPLQDARPASDQQLSRRFSDEALLQSCKEQSLSIWEFDATRPDLDIPCIKLLSPDLCTWEPRFGKKRLYEAPVKWGALQKPLTEAAFADRPFPF